MLPAKIVVGLQFGDEGKGALTDYLCRQLDSPLVIRYCGGSQAGHNVVTADGRHHCFSQIGAGAFAGAATLLSRHMMVDPIALAQEATALSPKLGRYALEGLYVDARAPVITPFHVAANRSRAEARGGSCGKGIGELARDRIERPEEVLAMGDLRDRDRVSEILAKIQARKVAEVGGAVYPLGDPDAPAQIADVLAELEREIHIATQAEISRIMGASPLVFEGSQGVLLDEWYGFHPFTTWSTVTAENALAYLAEHGDGSHETEIIGVTRPYLTRHGAGPMPTEGKFGRALRSEHNDLDEWQGEFRTGAFDFTLHRYAVEALGRVDSIAMTHLDDLGETVPVTAPGARLPLPLYRDTESQAVRTRLIEASRPSVRDVPVDRFLAEFETLRYQASGPTANDWTKGTALCRSTTSPAFFTKQTAPSALLPAT